MTSKLVTCMDDIQAIWEALTPPSTPTTGASGTYRRIRNLSNVNRRTFWFGLADAKVEEEFGGSFALVRYEFPAHVRLDLTGLDLISAPEMRANEGSLLTGAINFHTSWSTGVRSVMVTGSTATPTDTGDVELELSIVALCEESDGS